MGHTVSNVSRRAIILLLLLPAVALSDEIETYLFGVFPHVPTSKLFEMYSPVAKDFEAKLGVPVSVRTRSSYYEFEEAIISQVYDIALIQPYNYPDAHDKYNYLPVARRSDQLSALLLVRKESDYQRLADIRGRIIASTAKTAAVSRLMESEVLAAGFDPQHDFVRVYKNNHFSCMQTVLIGGADACITSVRALDHYHKVKLIDKFRIIHESKKIPHVLYVVHKRVPQAHRDAIKQTILNWQNTPSGREILAQSQMIGFSEAHDSEYDVLR